MNDQKQQELINLFPSAFQVHENYPISLFGIECGEGWYDLLYNLIVDLKAVVERKGLEDFRVHQIKEKYGTLRFYVSYYTEEIENRIALAEAASATICENCGKQGTLGTKDNKPYGWITCLCEDCRKVIS